LPGFFFCEVRNGHCLGRSIDYFGGGQKECAAARPAVLWFFARPQVQITETALLSAQFQ